MKSHASAPTHDSAKSTNTPVKRALAAPLSSCNSSRRIWSRRPNTRSTAPSAASMRDARGPTIQVCRACSPTSPITPRNPSPLARNLVNPSTTRSRSATETPNSSAITASRFALRAFQPPETTSTASASRSNSVSSLACTLCPGCAIAAGATTVADAGAACMRAAARRAAAGCSG
ncbi:MAG: hypothetical protein LW636_11685, partial [Planctomycetaceae bacterium]|nr:hypothetical protein [Planctomycetaceae bacterium]